LTWDQECESPEVAAKFRPLGANANERNLDRPQSLLAPGPGHPTGDWVLAFDLYRETIHQRMTAETTGDRITVVARDLKLEGGIRDGTLELKRSGKDGPPVTMSDT
jgi:hypothetical protein